MRTQMVDRIRKAGSCVDTRYASQFPPARGSAALARADAEKLVNAGVLTSDWEASHTDEKSAGRAVTNGFELGVLDAIRVVLLHSEVSSEGRGHSYLVGLNGTEVGTDDQ